MLNWLAAAKRRLLGESLSVSEPTDFVTQILEPTGGKILRPRNWFYSEGHRGPTLMWTISREDSRNGAPYITGVRIQVFRGLKAGAGKTAEQFIRDFSATKSSQSKVIETFPEVDQGLFRRIGIQTEEGANRIIYSLFWGKNDLDIAAISIAGTSKELWDVYSSTFQAMGEFEIIDMARFS
jgi:hypothetical protein